MVKGGKMVEMNKQFNLVLSQEEAEYLLDTLYGFLFSRYQGKLSDEIDLSKADISAFGIHKEDSVASDNIKTTQSIVKKLDSLLKPSVTRVGPCGLF